MNSDWLLTLQRNTTQRFLSILINTVLRSMGYYSVYYTHDQQAASVQNLMKNCIHLESLMVIWSRSYTESKLSIMSLHFTCILNMYSFANV